MSNHDNKSEKDRDKTEGKAISLHPLTPEQALFAVMNTKPPERKSASKKRKKAS